MNGDVSGMSAEEVANAIKELEQEIASLPAQQGLSTRRRKGVDPRAQVQAFQQELQSLDEQQIMMEIEKTKRELAVTSHALTDAKTTDASGAAVQLYCVCRQPDNPALAMIMCDGCQEW